MKEREHVLSALKAQKIEFREHGQNIDLLSREFAGASINLSTGMITSGDVDQFRNTDAGKLGLLRQAYSEAKFRAVAFKEGHMIGERSIEKNGDVTLICRMA
jgi:hypothetical protein